MRLEVAKKWIGVYEDVLAESMLCPYCEDFDDEEVEICEGHEMILQGITILLFEQT